ncbi:MAG: DUF885 family protein [Egibacteraceae bacterium]
MHDVIDGVFDGYRRHLLEFAPVAATAEGDHRRDADLDDWPPGAADERLRDLGRLRAELNTIEDFLDEEADGDRLMLANALDAQRFAFDGLRSHERDPTFWLDLATSGVYELIRRDDLDPGPRRPAAAARAAQIPRLLGQARATLDGITAPHREVALLRAPAAAALFRDLLGGFAPEAAEAGEAAAAACEEFAAWLDEHRDDPAPDWRLGEKRWSQAFRLMLGGRMSAARVWERAWAELKTLQAMAEETAFVVLEGHRGGRAGADLVRAGLEVAAADRPTREGLLPEAAAILGEIVAFIRETGLFPLPEPDTLRVEELPGFRRGVFDACLLPAPPLEPTAAHTYYLSPVSTDWDDERATSFLREYNRSALRLLGIHEAYPGHYVQYAHARAHPRLLRRMMVNHAFLEGWAVYVEHEIVSAGFGDAALGLTSTKRGLRVVTNALLDQGLHVHGWDDDTALKLMVGQTYQEPAAAAAKLRRGKMTAGQLSTYFVGGQEMADLRHEMERLCGPGFSPAEFHEEVLAHGTPPFAVLRRTLLE